MDSRDGNWTVPADAPPARLDKALRQATGLSWGEVRDLIRRGKVFRGDEALLDPAATIAGGQALSVRMDARRPVPVDATVPVIEQQSIADWIVHEDAQVIVVRKPAGIATVPFVDKTARGPRRMTGDREPTLDRLVAAHLAQRRAGARSGAGRLRVVQRLDRDTTGLLVFAKTAAAEEHLAQQLRKHTAHRRYVAIAHGVVATTTIRSRLVQDRGDGRRGSTEHQDLGKEAITHVRPLVPLRGATLVECRLETGRTHQIRIHLSEDGHPIVGDVFYVRGWMGEVILAPRLMLHASQLGFVHPTTQQDVRFEEPMPADMQELVHALRSRSARGLS